MGLKLKAAILLEDFNKVSMLLFQNEELAKNLNDNEFNILVSYAIRNNKKTLLNMLLKSANEAQRNKIFDYIALHHMRTESKVANRIRSDAIVLRMTDYDDALKVMDFINRDPELVMYAKPTNPFIMKNGKVGVSYDDNISYNATSALMLSQYFEYCRKNNLLKKVSHKHFRDYVHNYLKNTFNDPKNLLAFQSLPEVARASKRFQSIGECLLNYEHVLRLMVMQLDGNMNMERFRSFYVSVKDYSKNRQMADYYGQLVESKEKNLNSSSDSADKNLIDDYIEYARKKYSNVVNVIAYLRKYTEEENLNAITRDHNFRERFQTGMTPKKALLLMQGNVEHYVREVSVEEKTEDLTKKESFAESFLQEYIDFARLKYGDSNVEAYLNKYVSDGLGCITRDQNFRGRFLQYLPPSKLLEITNQDISAYVERYIRSKVSEQTPEKLYEIFVNACIATYQKYGYNQLRKAIECGFTADYNYFTDGNNQFRAYLASVTPEEFSSFCAKLLTSHGISIGDNNDIYDKCVEAIQGMVASKNNTQIKQVS